MLVADCDFASNFCAESTYPANNREEKSILILS